MLGASLVDTCDALPAGGCEQMCDNVVMVDGLWWDIDPVDQAGITAWKTRGADLRYYLGGRGKP